MASDSEQHQEFQMRLQRISQHDRDKTQMIFVGEDEAYRISRRQRRARSAGLGSVLSNAFHPFAPILALAIGALGHAAGMLLRFDLSGLGGWSERPDIEMVVQLFVGFGIAMVACGLIGLRNGTHAALTLAGAAAGVLFFHNAVHLYPEFFTQMTSALWVSKMLAQTKPHSLLWMGISLQF